MRTLSTTLLLGLAGLMATTGCESNDAPAPAPTATATAQATAAETAAAKPDQPRRGPRDRGMRGEHGRGGPTMMVKLALKKLELDDEQKRKLGALETRPKKDDDARTKREEAKKALADAVRAGSIDVDALSRDAPEGMRHDAMVETLGTLHATLTPEQRKELVSMMTDRSDDARRGRKRGDDGHGRRGKRGRGVLAKVLQGIDVTDEQRTKIETALADADLAEDEDGDARKEAMKAKQEALLEAFVKDDFDAAAHLVPDEANMHRKHLQRLAVVVPLLDDAQRTELAERIESGGRRGKGRRRTGGRGRGGPGGPDAPDAEEPAED